MKCWYIHWTDKRYCYAYCTLAHRSTGVPKAEWRAILGVNPERREITQVSAVESVSARRVDSR